MISKNDIQAIRIARDFINDMLPNYSETDPTARDLSLALPLLDKIYKKSLNKYQI